MTGVSEKQKMLSGQPYFASDPVLVSERMHARKLIEAYNSSSSDNPLLRSEILRKLFQGIGPGEEIEPPFYCDYGNNISIGKKFFANFGCAILDCNRVTIGDNVLMGPYVQVYAAYHPVDPLERLSGRELSAPVIIGNNVWIGGGVIVLPGVTIGDNSVIGAGSVVTKNIPENSVAAGNPCVIKRKLE